MVVFKMIFYVTVVNYKRIQLEKTEYYQYSRTPYAFSKGNCV